jgi:hypothetical protein
VSGRGVVVVVVVFVVVVEGCAIEVSICLQK